MIRRLFIPGAIAAAIVAAGTGSMAASAPLTPSAITAEKSGKVTNVELVRSDDTCAIYYDHSLTEPEFLARAGKDAERLGFPFVKTLAAGNVLIVKATEQQARERLANAEGIPFTHVGPSYRIHNEMTTRALAAFSNRVMMRFKDSISEAEKESFYKANNLTRIKEYGSGNVLVETSRPTDSGMIAVAKQIASHGDMITEASSDLLMTGELTANSDSIEIEDPLFYYQWYLFNSGVNTTFGAGTPDEDLDVPRAWMINQRNMEDAPGLTANGIYGDSEIVVGVFDSGIQITHEDLAESMDPAIGFSAIGGAPINSGGGIMAAHGTFMAGLVGAAKNTTGVIGVAPGVKLYALKIFANDLSTSTSSLAQAIENTVSATVDINVHPYTLVLNASDSSTTVVEDALRRSFESGRGGLGTANFAASGNFHAQVEYPAHSQWAIAVGSVSSDGLSADGPSSASGPEHTGVPRHNWGGKGVDFVMPSYGLNVSSATTQSSEQFIYGASGVVSTDLTASSGITNPNPNLPGNEAGNYASVGLMSGFTSNSAAAVDTATRYRGTSVSAALAGGVAALLLSDERYTDLPPFLYLSGGNGETRNARRLRAPLRGQENFDNLLSRMKNFSDLPNGNNFFYIDQSSELNGFGRPNPARALSLPGSGANVSPDGGYRAMLESTPVYEVAFDGIGLAGDNNTEAAAGTLAKGWKVRRGVDATLTSGGSPVTISPYLEGVTALYEEGLNPITSGTDDDGNPLYFYVWTDSVTTAPQGSENVEIKTENLIYNPDGRYLGNTSMSGAGQANRTISIESPDIIAPASGAPMVLDLKLAHELGAQNTSSNGLSAPDGRVASISTEADTIKFYIDPKPLNDGDPDPDRFEVATITGDSTGNSKTRLTQAAVISQDVSGTTRYFPSWPGPPSNRYLPYVAADQMIIRNYSFFVRGLAPGTPFQIVMELNPGESYLPSYSSAPGPPVTYTQLHNVHRDMRGFIFTGAKLTAFTQNYVDLFNGNVYELSDGQFPAWSANRNEVMLARLGFSGTDSFLVQADRNPLYLTDPSSLASGSMRPNMILTNTDGGEVITGLAAHPDQEILAMTTSSGTGQFLHVITNDGVDQKQIIDPSLTIGARDPSWSNNGTQLVYCSFDYIRIASLQDNGDWHIETVLDATQPTVFLEDFHSPVFDALSGVIYFSARRRDVDATDHSLKIFVTTRTGRVLSYGVDPRTTIAGGFDNIDVFDLNVSSTGRRLIFSANASAPATYDLGTGDLIDSATPSSACALFSIENFYNVVNYGDPPDYRMIVLQSVDPGFPKVSARWARISPENTEIVWQAFDVPVNVNTGTGNGRIVRQPIGLGPEDFSPPIFGDDPLPPPTVTPTGTPPAPDLAHVIYSGGYNFVADQQGWEFRNAAPVYDASATSYDNVDTFPTEIDPGLIAFTASSENPVNGNGVLVATLNFDALQVASSPLDFQLVSPNRTRVQDANGVDYGLTTENGSINVASRSTNVRLYFSPAASNTTVGASTSVDVLMDTNGLDVHDIQAYITFNRTALRFTSGVVNGTEFERVRGLGRVTMSATSLNTFGYAESATSVLSVQQDSMYLYRAFISATPGTAPDRVPTVRLRVNSLNLESSFSSEVNSLGDLTMTPNADGPKALDLLFQPPPELFTLPLGRRRYTLAVDLLNFTPGDDPTGGIILSGVEIYRLDNAATKSVIKNPETIFNTDFATQSDRALWSNGPLIPEFTPPEFLAFPSSLAMRVINKANTFGFWTADGNDIPVSTPVIDPDAPTVIYRATYVIRNEQESNALRVPDYRLRLATNDFQRSAASSVITVGDGVTAPVPGKPRTVYVFLVLEEVPADFNAFVAAFDILSFYPGRNITDKPLEVDSLKIERVYIPGYPATR